MTKKKGMFSWLGLGGSKKKSTQDDVIETVKDESSTEQPTESVNQAQAELESTIAPVSEG